MTQIVSTSGVNGPATDFTSVWPVILVDTSGNAINVLTSGSSTYVSSLNGLVNAVTITGLGSVSVTTAGQSIRVSGSTSASVTTPSTTVANGIATWSGTSGAGLLDTPIQITGSMIFATGNSLTIQGNFLDLVSSSFYPGSYLTLHNDQGSFSADGGLWLTAAAGSITATASGAVHLGAVGGNSALDLFSNGNVTLTSQSGKILSLQGSSSTDIYSVGGLITLNSVSGVTTDKSITPSVSGSSNIGTTASPFAGVVSNQYATTLVPNIVAGPTGSTVALNWNSGSVDTLTVNTTGNVAVTLANGIAGSTYILKTVNASGGTISWPTGTVIWPAASSGTMTTGVGSVDLFTFVYDGTKYLANANNDYR